MAKYALAFGYECTLTKIDRKYGLHIIKQGYKFRSTICPQIADSLNYRHIILYLCFRSLTFWNVLE